MSSVACRDVDCDRCGRTVGADCLRRVEHRHRVYNLAEGTVCGSCWVVTLPAPEVRAFKIRPTRSFLPYRAYYASVWTYN